MRVRVRVRACVCAHVCARVFWRGAEKEGAAAWAGTVHWRAAAAAAQAAGLCVAAHVSRRSRRSLTTASECGGAVCRRSCLSPVKALTHRNNDICLERQNDEDNWN